MTILGLAAAPALDTDQPWFDYETWALSNASSKSTTLLLGPLLRPAGLAARRPRAAAREGEAPGLLEGDQPRRLRRRAAGCATAARPTSTAATSRPTSTRAPSAELQRIRVSVRNLRTQTFVTAGVACADRLAAAVLAAARRRHLREHEPRAAPRRRLRRARLHAEPERPRAPRGAAAPIRRRCSATRASSCRRRCRPTPTRRPPPTRSATGCSSRCSASPGGPMAQPLADPGARLRPRPAQRAARGPRTRAPTRSRAGSSAESDTQEDYVQAVMRYLRGDEFAYTESPPRAAENLDGFLFDAKSGYCQQFSGAMALLLRMGGVPARVSTGFTTGAAGPQGGRVRRARPRRPLVGRGLVRGLRLGDDGPDAGRRARALAGRRRRTPAAAGDPRAPRTSAATSAPTRAAALAATGGGHAVDADRRRRGAAALLTAGAGALAAAPPPPPRRGRLGPGRRARARARAHPPRARARPPR